MVTKHPSQLVQKTVSWQIYNEQATHPTDYRMSTECLQRYAVQSSDQTPIHQLRHTLCLFYQNMIQRIDGQKADLYITLTLCNKDFI